MKVFQVIIGIVFVVAPWYLSASHLRSVEITARRIDCNVFSYEITIVAYVNTSSPVLFGGSGNILRFGDGAELTIPELASQEIDASLHVGRVEFKTTHTYSAAGAYTISYTEENRTA